MKELLLLLYFVDDWLSRTCEWRLYLLSQLPPANTLYDSWISSKCVLIHVDFLIYLIVMIQKKYLRPTAFPTNFRSCLFSYKEMTDPSIRRACCEASNGLRLIASSSMMCSSFVVSFSKPLKLPSKGISGSNICIRDQLYRICPVDCIPEKTLNSSWICLFPFGISLPKYTTTRLKSA